MMKANLVVRSALIAAMIALLTLPAAAQRMSKGGGNRGSDQKTDEQKKKSGAIDKAYKDALDKIPTPLEQNSDPWRKAR